MKARILVVDDEAMAREELCEALTGEGYETRGCADGDEALVAARDGFDVCITDMRMPGLSGLDLLHRLRETSPETLVVLVTAYGDMESAIAALRQGATDFLLKPLRIDDLLGRLERMLERRDLVVQVRRERLPKFLGPALLGRCSARAP